MHISFEKKKKIGLQPEFKIALTDAIKVFDGTIISLPLIFKDKHNLFPCPLMKEQKVNRRQ